MVAVLEKLDIKDKEKAYDQKVHPYRRMHLWCRYSNYSSTNQQVAIFISLIVEQDKDDTKLTMVLRHYLTSKLNL